MKEQLLLLHELKQFLEDIQPRISKTDFTEMNQRLDKAIDLNIKNQALNNS